MTVRKSLDRLRGSARLHLRRMRFRSLRKIGTMKLFKDGVSRFVVTVKRSGSWMQRKTADGTIGFKHRLLRSSQPTLSEAENEAAAALVLQQVETPPLSQSAKQSGTTGRRYIADAFKRINSIHLKDIPLWEAYQWLRSYRLRLLSAVGALGVASVITAGADQYVKLHTYDAYHVIVNGTDIGMVSNPQVVEDYKLAKYKELEQKYPDLHMVLNADGVTFRDEKAFKIKTEDQTVLAKLDTLLTAHPIGAEIKVDGKVVGILKDKDTAQQVLDQIKATYIPKDAKDPNKVGILSAPKELQSGSELDKVDFVQKVDMDMVDVTPEDISKPDDVLKKLETGDVQPTKYTVQQGDCVGCIAKKFNISRQVIYQNNPSIVDDKIKVGQVLDLTVLQPTLSVRTVETVVEDQEIQYDTNYVKDDSMRAGVVQVISPGKNGMKKVKIQVTKVNGLMEDEQVLDETITQQPVTAVVKKGTKVILGEGTGKFAWPVLGASISSTFGMRWGVLHKGLDLTSGNKSILAADNGKVVYAGFTSDYGNHIILDHQNGYRTLYAHLSSYTVKVGQTVEKGEKMGIMGATGDATGVHLHFEIQVSGSVENPLKFLNR